MTENELIHTMVLTRLLPYQSALQHQLIQAAGSAQALYENRHTVKELIPNASERLVKLLAQWDEHIARAEEEMAFAEKGHIEILTPSHPHYPARLSECQDAPVLLFYRGSADLNTRRILSIVGTRKATDYGRHFCEKFLADMSRLCPEVLVVSGLAYGIDISAHRQALAHGLSTVGVLAHGLDQIYPRMHRQTAVEMLSNGGLLTEFMSQSTAEKINFVSRNRIVAGMADATLVVESAERGGSLITAGLAEDYGRDVFAVPGRIGDTASAGCNLLIRDCRACLVQSAQELAEHMQWASPKAGKPIQQELFPELSSDEMTVFEALKMGDGKQLNQLSVEVNMPIGQLSSLLFDMEMRGLVHRLSGGLYTMGNRP